MRAGFAFIALIIGGLRCEEKLIQDDVSNFGGSALEAKVDLLQTIVFKDNRRLRHLVERERAGRRVLEKKQENMAHTIRNLTARLAEEDENGMEMRDALYIQLETFENIVKLNLGTEKQERKLIVENMLVVKQQLMEMQTATDRVPQVTSQDSVMLRNVREKLESYYTEVKEAQGSIAQIETGYSSVLHQLDSLKKTIPDVSSQMDNINIQHIRDTVGVGGNVFQDMAQSMCTVSTRWGYVVAVWRDCDGSRAAGTCNDVCTNIARETVEIFESNRKTLTCFHTFLINTPKAKLETWDTDLKVFAYNYGGIGCSWRAGECGPNYCCCGTRG